MNFKVCTRRTLKTIWLSGLAFIFFEVLLVAAFGQDLPPLPPDFKPSTTITATPTSAVFAIAPPAPTNSLPFNFWTRKSGDWTLASIASKTNVLRFSVIASTNANFSVTNAEWNIVFKSWPATQHLHGFGINDGVSKYAPPTELYYRVTQYR